MARAETQKAAKKKIADGIPAGHADTLAEEKIAGITEAYSEERDLASQLLGQAQMASAISKFAGVVSLSKLKHVKEAKLYKAYAGKSVILPSGENCRLVGTWAEYCELLGTSASKVDEDLTNLNTFGEEALGNLNRIGAGYRELRQLRKLPEDVRELVQGKLINLTDKDEVIALIDDIAAREAAATKELTEATENYEAQGAVLKKKDETLNKLEKQLHKLQNRAGDWNVRAAEIAIETTRHAAGALEMLDKLDVMRETILNEDFGEVVREAAIESMAVVYYDAITQIVNRIAEVTDACDEVFIGYKEKARPILDVEAFMQKSATQPATKAKK